MFWRCLSVAALVAATLACSEPPTKERQQAEGAIAAARAAGAETYAAAELQAASQALADYDAAVAQRDYRQALRFAVEARNGAYDAAKRAADGKAAARSQADQLAATLDELLRVAGAKPLPSGRVAADKIRAARASATATLQKARSLIEAQQYAESIAVLTPVVEAMKAEPLPVTGAPARRTP